jgi:hypothetical protein
MLIAWLSKYEDGTNCPITSYSHSAARGRLGRQKQDYIDVYVKKFESNSDDTFPRLTESARFR